MPPRRRGKGTQVKRKTKATVKPVKREAKMAVSKSKKRNVRRAQLVDSDSDTSITSGSGSSNRSTSPDTSETEPYPSGGESESDSGRESSRSSSASRSPSTSPSRSPSPKPTLKKTRRAPPRKSARAGKMMEIDEDFKPPALKQQNVSENGVSSVSSSENGENGRKKHKHKHKHHKKDREKERSHHHDRDRDRHSHSHKEESKKRKASNSSDDEVPLFDRKKVKTESDDEVPLLNRKQNRASDDDVPLSNRKVVKEESDDDVPLLNRKTAQASDSDDDVPLSARKIKKEDSDDEVPLSQRKKVKTEHKPKPKAKVKRDPSSDSDSEYERRKKQKKKSNSSTSKASNNKKPSSSSSPTKSPTKKKPKEEEEEVWKWWEEDRRDDGVKWTFLEHKGPLFAPDYEPLPKSVHFKYAGKPLKLSQDTEEVAGFYARLIEHDYTTKEKFNTNFWKDWRKIMTKEEREIIVDLKKCDFSEINEHYKQRSEERKNMSKEEKQKIKEEKEQIQKEYGFCIIDGHKEKIGNFNIEPPGLFRGRGEHPKMGMLKKRVMPEDVVINCSKDSKIPPPPKGHRWKEVRHNNTASWLAGWTENVQGQQKYVMLNVTSRLKGEKDWLKYEKARELAKHIDKIRKKYTEDFKHKEMRVRQRAVALYFIDRLALRAGNEKDEDQADTVGCCSLRVEHVELHEKKNIDGEDKEWVVVFDFLGKDSIRYFNQVPVEKRVFKNLKHFMENKRTGDDLFDRLNTTILNEHLKNLMDGLSAKVFRTYNASHTLQQQLDELTPKTGSVAQKLLAYNRANRAVAILCNHQRAPPKSHEKSMETLEGKIDAKKKEVSKTKKELKHLNKGSKDYEKKKAALKRLEEQLSKLEMNKTDKEEGKEIALGTSKLNYLDPRISVAWCKKHDIPIEKVYNKTQRAKFRWALDMADKHFKFN